MLKALDVARLFVFEAKCSGDNSMSNLKLNKMLYFAQGLCLARYGRTLFEEQIEAWEYGPVVPCVYAEYKGYGESNIVYEGDGFDFEKFGVEEMDAVMSAVGHYGCYTPSRLVSITHNQKPWQNARKSDQKHGVISNNDIRDCFIEIEKDFQREEANKAEFIGYLNGDGHLVLPKEWDDD